MSIAAYGSVIMDYYLKILQEIEMGNLRLGFVVLLDLSAKVLVLVDYINDRRTLFYNNRFWLCIVMLVPFWGSIAYGISNLPLKMKHVRKIDCHEFQPKILWYALIITIITTFVFYILQTKKTEFLMFDTYMIKGLTAGLVMVFIQTILCLKEKYQKQICNLETNKNHEKRYLKDRLLIRENKYSSGYCYSYRTPEGCVEKFLWKNISVGSVILTAMLSIVIILTLFTPCYLYCLMSVIDLYQI